MKLSFKSYKALKLTAGTVALAFALGEFPVSAATNIITTSADTALLEVGPDNNVGGFIGMNSGTTQNYTKCRALFRFDLSWLPTNALIQYAALQLDVTREPNEPPNNTTFGLHRMLRGWGEGNKNPTTFVGQGLPATPGEATWNCAFHPTNTWSSPGGVSGVDFSAVESSFKFIYGTVDSPYLFPSTPEMVGDVDFWVKHPASNFGWMLLCNDEASNFTARRFGTREDVNHQPLLEIHYLIPAQLTISKTNSNPAVIRFTAVSNQTYDVESRTSLGNSSWTPLAHVVSTPTNHAVSVTDTNSTNRRFFRANTY